MINGQPLGRVRARSRLGRPNIGEGRIGRQEEPSLARLPINRKQRPDRIFQTSEVIEGGILAKPIGRQIQTGLRMYDEDPIVKGGCCVATPTLQLGFVRGDGLQCAGD